jgi:hypothetical protein
MNKLQDLHKEEFDLATRFVNSYAAMMEERRGPNAINSDKLYDRHLMVLLGRSLKSLQAILNLCMNGFGEDAGILLRAVVEATITFCYICMNPEKNGLLYQRYEFITELEGYEKLKRLQPVYDEQEIESKKEECREAIADTESKLTAMDSTLSASKLKDDDRMHRWSGKSIRGMAKDLGAEFERQYDLTFWIFSGYTHANPFWMRDLQHVDGDRTYIDVRPGSAMVGDVLVGGVCYYAVAMMQCANKQFKLNNEPMIQSLVDEYRSFGEKMLQRMRGDDKSKEQA